MTWVVAGSDRATRCAAKLVVCLVACAGIAACASAPRSARARAETPRSLESYMARVRAASQAARPRPSLSAQTVETWDPSLSAALLELLAAPTAAHHRKVAIEYRRLGILDRAHEHLSAALRLDPQDAAAFDGRARIWRDWGYPHLGLGDAYRAVDIAPASAPAANTLGTLLQAQGRIRDASQWYSRALALDPDAAYAQNNLCYASIYLRRAGAVGDCQRAVALGPQLKNAHNNLALAYAASGNFQGARRELALSGTAAVAEYNAGILYLADRQFDRAAAAFDAAVRLDPHFDRAGARARQARAGADAGE